RSQRAAGPHRHERADRSRLQGDARRHRRGIKIGRERSMTLQRDVIVPKNPGFYMPRNLTLPLSPAIRAGAFIFVSGMVAIDPSSGERMHGTVAAETRQVLTAMAQVLEAAGSSLAKAVKVNVR